MSTLLLSLDSTAIKRPNNFKIDTYKITKASRLANGNMKMQYINKKRKFYLTYDAIDASDLEVILGIIDGEAVSFNLAYLDNNVAKTASVYVGPISRILLRTGAVWIWKTLTFDLIEN